MRRKPVIYFASPYSSDNFALTRARAKQIIEITAVVYNSGIDIVPLSPIALTDQFAYLEEITEEMWRELVLHYLLISDGMIIFRMPGWDVSKGINRELNCCLEHNIPYKYADPWDYLSVCEAFASEFGSIRERVRRGILPVIEKAKGEM